MPRDQVLCLVVSRERLQLLLEYGPQLWSSQYGDERVPRSASSGRAWLRRDGRDHLQLGAALVASGGGQVPRLASYGVMACAIAMTALAFWREFRPQAVTAAADRALREGWPALAGAGHSRGAPDSPVTVVVFSDFQCPACRHFALRTIAPVMRQYPRSIRYVYRHWPLSYHPHAYAASVASECAAAQGRFWEYHDALFSAQDSIGKRPFVEYATKIELADTATFSRCLASTAISTSIDADMTDANRIEAKGTPTVVIDGVVLGAVPDSAALSQRIRRILQNR